MVAAAAAPQHHRHTSYRGWTGGRAAEQANVSVELPHPPEFRLSFYERKKSGASNAAARKVAVAAQGRKERRQEGGRNGKTVLKFPLAATAAAAAAVRVGLLVCRLHRRGGCDDGNDEQSERPRERKRPEGSRDCSRLSRSGFVSGKKTIFILHLIFPTAANAHSQLTATAAWTNEESSLPPTMGNNHLSQDP